MKSACFTALCVAFSLAWPATSSGQIEQQIRKLQVQRGVVALLGGTAEQAIQLAKDKRLTVYMQVGDKPKADANTTQAGRNIAEADRIRQTISDAKLLGDRVFVVSGGWDKIHLATNLADAILVGDEAAGVIAEDELLRALRPQGVAYVGDRELVKPVPEGIDEWTHPYHGPDNNPQSYDKYVKGSFRTQFLGYPMFSPMPEQSVAAGGRIYKALGHIAHKANQNEMLSTLLCVNAYNGTILWKRPLPKGFMIHRNTMIATEDGLYMGDHESCKVFDGATGEIVRQIRVDEKISDGPVWKWMAMKDGVLYALVGNPEIQIDIQKSTRRGLGHWPWGMWKGHDYNDPRTAFGFGRTVVAIDLKSGEQLWHHRDPEFLDARAVCMNDRQIFAFCPGKFLACIDRQTGSLLWRNTDKRLLEAIGDNGKAQHYVTGYATTCYMKCSNDYIFFAGPQRKQLVAARAKDGNLAWTYPTGNLQLVLREDGVWAAGPQKSQSGVQLDYATGDVLAEFPARRACTRATGCVDSIFFRASGGTVRVLTGSNTAQHIAPMRPPCQDGVLISNGHLYWGPWMCGCQLSLYGNIALAPADAPPTDADRLYRDALTSSENFTTVASLAVAADDWPAYRANNSRDDVTKIAIPGEPSLDWKVDVCSTQMITAPVAAGGLIFVADRSGAVRAFDQDGKAVWSAFAGGPVYYPPAVAYDRVFVGAADGRVYAYEAKTGRFLWSFRVAPEDRLIPVYEKLISTWPVSGGVVVQDETVYAAAGVAHYDGTYVVALDAPTGQLKAHNTTSGTIAPEVNNGISLQGNLAIVDDELRFLAGGVYETARYDLKTLKCLNSPKVQVNSQFRTAFYPYYPEYAKYVSLDYTCADGCTLNHDASYEGSKFTNLALQEPLPPGIDKPFREAARWIVRRGGVAPKELWKDGADRRFTSFVISGDTLLAAGHPESAPDRSFLAATNIRDGQDRWSLALPACAVKGGVAIVGDRILVSLENGQLLSFRSR